METRYKLSIPKPCHEDWRQMKPDETGRFCNSCAKSVVDFTNMKATEIQQFFIQNKGEKVCGRFKSEQLDSIIIQIPRAVLFSQVQFHKMFLLALLISMPGIVSSQNTNGTKQRIEKVEVVDSLNLGLSIGKAEVKNPVPANGAMTPERKARLEKLKQKREALVKKKKRESTQMGDTLSYLSGVVSIDPKTPTQFKGKDSDVYMTSAVKVKPSFAGGLTKFYEYINSNLKVSDQDTKIDRKIFISFVVGTDGSLSEIKILRGINTALDNEVIRVVKSSKWIPGEQDGKKVKVLYSLPIKITAQ